MRGYRAGLLVMTALLSACAKKDASGIYMLTTDREVTLVQIVESEDHKLTGRIEVSSIDGNGQVVDKASSFDGSVSDNDLLIRPTNALIGGPQASGTYDRDSITLTSQGFTFSAKRADLAKYQDAVGHLKAAAAEWRAKHEQLKAQLQTSDQAAQVRQIAANIRRAVPRLNDAVSRSPDFASMAAANTAKVQRMVQAAPSMGSVDRSQLGVEANQVVVASNQIEVSRQQYANELDSIVGGVKAEADKLDRLCGSNPNGALEQPCGDAEAAYKEFAGAVTKGRGSFSPQKVRVQDEIKRQEQLAAKIDG